MQMPTPKSVSSRIKHLWNNYKYLNFHLKTKLRWPLMCKLYLKILQKLCRFGLFREEANQVEVLEGESVFCFFHKRKLIDDSFEHSGSHLCLKTVHLALHWEATQQKSPQYPFSFPGKQELPYDKLTIFTRSRKKHRQQLVLVFRQL